MYRKYLARLSRIFKNLFKPSFDPFFPLQMSNSSKLAEFVFLFTSEVREKVLTNIRTPCPLDQPISDFNAPKWCYDQIRRDSSS